MCNSLKRILARHEKNPFYGHRKHAVGSSLILNIRIIIELEVYAAIDKCKIKTINETR